MQYGACSISWLPLDCYCRCHTIVNMIAKLEVMHTVLIYSLYCPYWKFYFDLVFCHFAAKYELASC